MSNEASRRVGTINGQPRMRARAKGKGDIDVQGFIDKILDIKVSIPARAAAALDYVAENSPGTIVPYSILQQMVMGYKHQPRVGTDEVKKLQSKMTAVGKILHEKYGRGKHSIPGVGVRATHSSADRLVTEVPKKRTAARAAMNSLTKSMSAINIKDVPNTPELKEHRDWFLHNSKNILDGSNDLIKRLLPAKK